ncbi:MAG TPA: hypothetical protein VER04_24600, partial [Polyangiaceae bacterium]|nr:hypothetical protein [Polyangiaceae bacterium]
MAAPVDAKMAKESHVVLMAISKTQATLGAWLLASVLTEPARAEGAAKPDASPTESTSSGLSRKFSVMAG